MMLAMILAVSSLLHQSPSASPRNHLLNAWRASKAGQSAATSKIKETDLVVARYREPLEWIDVLHTSGDLDDVRVLVYDKSGEGTPPNPVANIAEWHSLENVGLEAHTYLYHIVKNYDSLAEKTVFFQGTAPSTGYQGHKHGGGHLLPELDFTYDYLCPGTRALYLPTCAVTTNETAISFREDLLFPGNASTEPSNELPLMCPSAATAPWTPWAAHLWPQEYLNKVRTPGAPRSLIEFWARYLQAQVGPIPQPVVLFAQGAQFTASAAQIRAHPKAFYERLLHTLSQQKESVEAYYLEMSWGYIFGALKSTTKCDAAGGHGPHAGRQLSQGAGYGYGYGAPPPALPPLSPGAKFAQAVGFQVVSSEACITEESAKEKKCKQIQAQITADVESIDGGVQCQITCGSLIFDIYVEVTGDASALVAAIDAAYPDLATLSNAFGVTVVSQTAAYQTTMVVAAPPSPPPPPPSPPPQCSTACDIFLDGASLSTTDFSFMCTKHEARGTTCKPMYNGGGCPSDMDICDMPHTPVGAVAPGSTGQAACHDAPGKWAAKKCAKKVHKNKCQKRRVQRNCKLSCGQC